MTKKSKPDHNNELPQPKKAKYANLKHDLGIRIATQVLLDEISKKISNNLACSPMSITVLLNLVASCFGGSDLKKWLQFLGSESVADLSAKSNQMILLAAANKEEEGGGPVLSFVNGVFTDKKYTWKPLFEELMDSTYEAVAMSFDFKFKRDEAIAEINKWAEDVTKGLIKELLSKQSVNDKTILILANALYFNGTWGSPFDERINLTRTFYLLNGETVQVTFMYKCCNCFLYGEMEGFKFIKLPYKFGKGADNRRFSMYFFLPDEKDGLPDLLKHVSSNPGFFNQRFELRNMRINHLMIPKYKFSYELDIKDALNQLGFDLPITLLDQMEMVDCVDGSQQIEVIELRQKSCIEVNERGTEAAATMYSLFGGGTSPNLDFIADHPFLFALKEDKSGIALFVGAVFNPLST